MIEEVGIVVSVQGDLAEVEGQRRGTCGGCAANGACGTSLIARHFGRKRLLLSAYNDIGAEPGDRVVLGLPEGALLEASFVTYIVPLLAMIGGGVAGERLAGLLLPEYTRVTSVLGGVVALAAALRWLGRFVRARRSGHHYRPTILRRAADVRSTLQRPPRDFSPEASSDGA